MTIEGQGEEKERLSREWLISPDDYAKIFATIVCW
jgi:hypothetical protein